MEKNVAGKWVVFAYGLQDHATPGVPITGDATNITANMRIDAGAANAVDDTNPTELEDGFYAFDITAVESNGDNLLLTPQSSTADVQVIAVPGAVWTRPPNFNALGIAADGDISGNVDGSVANVVGAVGSVTGNVGGSVGSVTGHTPQTGDTYALASGAAGFAAIDTVVDAIKAVTDLLPNGGALNDLATLVARLTSARAGYLDELSAANLPADIDALLTRLTATRASYLDKLNITGNVASSGEVTAIQNNTLVRVMVPTVIERPDSGSTLYKLHIYIYDTDGNMAAPDSLPTIAAENEAGTSRSSNLSAVTLESAGHYSATYTVAVAHLIEQLVFEWTIIENAVTRLHGANSQIVDTTAVDFTAADRTKLDTLHDTRLTAARAGYLDELAAANIPADVDALTAAIGALNDFDPTATPVELLATGGTAGGKAADELIDDNWDEVLTGGTHNVPNSSGKRLRVIQEAGTYEHGAVWIDTVDGLAGTTPFDNGTITSKSLTFADAIAIANHASLNLKRFELTADSSITLGATINNRSMSGHGWTLALGGQNIAGMHFIDAEVSGISSGSNAEFHQCHLNGITFDAGALHDSYLEGTTVLSSIGQYHIHNCHAADGGITPIIDIGAALGNTTAMIHNWHGKLELHNLGQVGTDIVNLTGFGEIDLDANCVGGTINIQGMWTVTGAAAFITAGGVINYDDNTTSIKAIEVDTSTTLPALIDDLAIKKNTALPNFPFLMVLASDGKTPATGLTVTGQRRLDNGSFVAVSGTITEVSNGLYEFDALAADTNCDIGTWKFSAATADDTFASFKTVQ